MRSLGIDLGSKTIGLALSDVGGVIATPLSTLPRHGGKRDLEAIMAVVREHEVSIFVLGLPLGLDGEENDATKRVRAFGDKLTEISKLSVEYVDERFTSVIAERAMLDANLKRKQRKEKVDHIAAAVILQSYLDQQMG